MLGIAVFGPAIRAAAIESTLCSDHQIGRVRIKSFGNDLFTDVWAVRIGGVDEIDSEINGAAKNPYSFPAIGRLAPNPFPGDSHRTESEAVYAKVIADKQLAGFCGGTVTQGRLCGCAAHESPFGQATSWMQGAYIMFRAFTR